MGSLHPPPIPSHGRDFWAHALLKGEFHFFRGGRTLCGVKEEPEVYLCKDKENYTWGATFCGKCWEMKGFTV